MGQSAGAAFLDCELEDFVEFVLWDDECLPPVIVALGQRAMIGRVLRFESPGGFNPVD